MQNLPYLHGFFGLNVLLSLGRAGQADWLVGRIAEKTLHLVSAMALSCSLY